MNKVKAFSNIGLSSSRAGKSGSFRAWTIARSYDLTKCNGSGKVDLVKLRESITKYKTSRTCRRWIAQSLELGIFTKRNGNCYYLSPDKVAVVYNQHLPDESKCKTILTPAWVAMDLFLSAKWRGELYGVVLEQRNDQQPISRATLTDLYGVSITTQKEYEKSNKKIVKKVNHIPFKAVKKDKVKIAKILKLNDHTLMEENNGELYTRKGMKILHGKLAQQIPNNYLVIRVDLCKKGATKKYRKLLEISCLEPRDILDRMYYPNRKTALRAVKRNGGIKRYLKSPAGLTDTNWWGEITQ